MNGARRLVASYKGLQVFDARDTIQVIATGTVPPEALRWFRVQGFTRRGNRVWDAPHNSQSIAAAQAIGTTFFSPDAPQD